MIGRSAPVATSILFRHLPLQTASIIWNSELPIDYDIRKAIGTIINYNHIQNDLDHSNLHEIKLATANNLINWHASQKWFHYNSSSEGTSSSATKSLGWKIKSSNNLLPTLDILNRNYPTLIQGCTLCLLCNAMEDSNAHFWSCPALSYDISSVFTHLSQHLFDLLTRYGDKLTFSIQDSINYSNTFSWVLRDKSLNLSPTLPTTSLLLLRSYISSDLYYIFRIHFRYQRTLMTHLLTFMDYASTLIKQTLWKKTRFNLEGMDGSGEPEQTRF